MPVPPQGSGPKPVQGPPVPARLHVCHGGLEVRLPIIQKNSFLVYVFTILLTLLVFAVLSHSLKCRFIKDYVICHGRAPEHTTTYSRGTFPEDEPFDMEKWRRGLQIKILDIAEDDVSNPVL